MDANINFDEYTLISLLAQCQTERVILESRLAQQQDLEATLERSILIARSRNAPIKRVPREILSMIFLELFELVRDNPTAIGPILLVCRLWNEIACSTVTLWSTVSAPFTAHIPDIIKTTRYMCAAIHYSANAPLRVDITLPGPTQFWECLGSSVITSLPNVPEEWRGDPRKEEDDMQNWLRLAHRYNYIESPPMKRLNSLLYGEMMVISGLVVGQVSRLRSVSIRFNSQTFFHWSSDGGFNLFYSPTPNLEELVLVDEARTTGSKSVKIFVNPIPSLRRVSWKTRTPISTILSIPTRLTHLRIPPGTDFRSFPQPQYTEGITHLFLENPAWNGSPIRLPRLRDLSLSGEVHGCIFESPRLITLRLLDHKSTNTGIAVQPCPYTSIQRLHISSHPLLWRLERLQRHLRLLPELTELGILFSQQAVTRQYTQTLTHIGITVKGYRLSSHSNVWDIYYNDYEQNEVKFMDYEQNVERMDDTSDLDILFEPASYSDSD